MTPSEIFSKWAERAAVDPGRWQALESVYLWDISGEDGGKWVVDCKDKPGVRKEDTAKPDCAIALSSSDFVSLASGELNPQKAFLMGRIKISGEFSHALRLGELLDQLVDQPKQ